MESIILCMPRVSADKSNLTRTVITDFKLKHPLRCRPVRVCRYNRTWATRIAQFASRSGVSKGQSFCRSLYEKYRIFIFFHLQQCTTLKIYVSIFSTAGRRFQQNLGIDTFIQLLVPLLHLRQTGGISSNRIFRIVSAHFVSDIAYGRCRKKCLYGSVAK